MIALGTACIMAFAVSGCGEDEPESLEVQVPEFGRPGTVWGTLEIIDREDGTTELTVTSDAYHIDELRIVVYKSPCSGLTEDAEVAYTLENLPSNVFTREVRSVSQLDAAFDSLVTGEYSVSVESSATSGAIEACAEIPGPAQGS